ncbi:PREDICTED: LEAF RUST 10 DISEASE-RESISTANCE LOCUS RECEPTOR-LIKE PROTEIN KINASE-like 2.2 [Nelumbo nucifera]|uniref:non-specific serine/threonine protein kinase n=1 Tax=Nelumbo nucifera TaxID=4432 RepID=A0A1U8A7W5_NELNU|nr:PREDICTED: LEAF RUST 10 DISEASE-RESISTANCE LOCUS RECEPTOR-LIKE PROTEIN KINASE-like 2.2 [Nelumbo nucifera]
MKKKISPLRYSILNKSSNSKEVKLNGGGEEAKEMRENPKNKRDPSSSEPLKSQVEKNNIKEYSHCQLDEIIQRDKMLGGGAYSEVYEGLLPEGTKVAVKLLKRRDGNEKDFKNEVLGISAASHINILRLRGYCSEKDVVALVSDYMPMTLLDCITGLDWEKLYKIALGVARGLRYLHMECPKPIIHLDIKPENILLDKDFTPKISDFGFAKHSLKRKDTKTEKEPRDMPLRNFTLMMRNYLLTQLTSQMSIVME